MTQALNVLLDQAVAIDLVSPQSALQGRPGHHDSPALHQQVQQPELCSSQGQPLTTYESFISGRIDQQAATYHWTFAFVRGPHSGPPQQRSNSGGKLDQVAGQPNVIISTNLQGRDGLHLVVLVSQHQ